MFSGDKHLFCAGLLALSLFTSSLAGQVASGSIVGLVTDAQGSIVANVKVEAKNVDTNQLRHAVTNDTGYYEFPVLAAGRYIVSTVAPGFQRAATSEITLHAGTKPKIDFQMSVGEITQTVQVAATAPLVNSTTTELGIVFDNAKVEALPLNGRSFVQLVGLQPGVINRNAEPVMVGSTAGIMGGIEFNGSPALGNNYLLDGVDMSFGESNAVGEQAAGTEGTGALINTVSVEAIREFKASSSAFSAEYGRATGGVINVTSKSGTNQLHGTLFEFFRNDVLDANNFFSNRSGLSRPPRRQNQYGGNLGGPILRDKLFFFFNYEGATVRRAEQVTANVPTPLLLDRITNSALKSHLSGLPKDFTPTANPLIGMHRRNDVRKNEEHTTLSRVEGTMRQHHLSGRFSYNHQDFSQPLTRVDNRLLFPTRFKNLMVGDTTTLSPTMINEARFGYNHSNLLRSPADGRQLSGNPNNSPLVEAPGLTRSDSIEQIGFDTTVYTVMDNLTIIRGAHTIKTGFEIRSIDSLRDQFGANRHIYNSIDDLVSDNTNRMFLYFGNPKGGTKTWNHAGFVQDEWRINKRLHLTLGVRYEYYTVFKGPIGLATSDPFGPRAGKGDPYWNPDKNNWAPRVGLVMDLSGDGKTILRLGGGIGYAPPQPLFYYDGTWIDPRVPFIATLSQVDIPSSLLPIRFPFSNAFVESVRSNPSSIPAGLVLGFQAPDINRRDEYAGQWNFSLQRALTSSTAVQASYVGSRGVKLYSANAYNLIDPATGRRPRPNLGLITYQMNDARSWYHALQMSITRRLDKGITLDVFYTHGKTMQYHNADGTLTGDNTTQDPNNIAGSVGPKQSDTRHRFTSTVSYQVPSRWTTPLARGFLGGWTLQGIINARTGYPLTATIGADVIGNGRAAGQRPDAVSGVSPDVDGSDRLLRFDRAAFDVNGPRAERRFGNLGYNTLRGPGAFWFDASLNKTFAINEQHRIQFRCELFNALNHPVFGNPSTSLSDPNFGRINNASEGRNIQLALKYTF